MSLVPVDVSLVIPTCGRPTSLERALVALGRQTFPHDRLEVIVVDDGDGRTAATIEERLRTPYRLHLLASRGAGAAAARNLGAAQAKAPLLLFLDDDIEASPGLVTAHVEAHSNGAQVTTGYLPATPSGARGFFAVALRGWWEAMFAAMRRPGHRYTFRDVLTGNCAVDTALFNRLGGFDPDLTCHEDYELGFRAVGAGARLRFVEAAQGVHHEVTTLERSMERKRAEGRADVLLARKHPALVPALPLNVFGHRATSRKRLLYRLMFRQRRSGRSLLRMGAESLALYEAARMRGRWTRRLYQLLNAAYWQGVAGGVETTERLGELLCEAKRAAAAPSWWLRVDLSEGLDSAMARIETARPDAVLASYGQQVIGAIHPVPGAEPLRGCHLQAALAQPLARNFVLALGRAGALLLDGGQDRIVPTGPLPRLSLQPGVAAHASVRAVERPANMLRNLRSR